MAYADQQMSTNKIVALVIVALIHVFVGYALVTGLAYKAAQQVIKKVTTVDIKEDKPKEEEPPPPPPEQPDTPPPPIVAPPPPINIAPAPPQVVTVQTPPPAPPPMIQTAPPIQAAPPPPPGPSKARGVRPKGQAGWAGRIQSNYPTRAAREEREGRVGVRVQIGADGRVSACSVSSSSGSPDLDEAACDGMTRYARFDPALDDGGNPISSNYSTAIVYKLN
ncbi:MULTISPECIES: TonB family protein [unclassified Novosphingobium]|uniref:TonB family protein n=1 Tax=unclassified Novosphingobium TaxID=2644732 RepID=UPI00135921D0|nr:MULTISPECIES: TonB family protein [unclassified Novosphingobium]